MELSHTLEAWEHKVHLNTCVEPKLIGSKDFIMFIWQWRSVCLEAERPVSRLLTVYTSGYNDLTKHNEYKGVGCITKEELSNLSH